MGNVRCVPVDMKGLRLAVVTGDFRDCIAFDSVCGF